MKNAVKVSVLIPVWNQEKLIIRALDSIPDRDDIEILVCDDGSTDGTAAAVQRYMDEHPERTILFNRQPVNRGEGATRNVLLDMASGEYIASLDADDRFSPEGFEKAMDQLDGTDIVYITWKENSGRVPMIDKSNKLFYCGLTLRLIRREFLGEDRCDPVRYAPDKTLSVKLDAREHTEKFTGIVAYLYNTPRAGSLVDLRARGYESMYNTILFYGNVCKIGGVETFFYEMARKYGDRDIT
ncbi:MAG: glycosyltransferase family 2 protein, partial [Oscillospiraceae bacterium]|nr:glycosyltransferase family 2 protein [Oscillospiraceae bacterium]